jgi:hypothetical protein
MLPDFQLLADTALTQAFLGKGINSFSAASAYIRQLPYRRNTDKLYLCGVLEEGCGTCGTKHAVLKQLADDHHIPGLSLIAGLFRMNASNTPVIAAVLSQYNLDHIPEAHCYLRYNGAVYDYTQSGWEAHKFLEELILEEEITPAQIAAYKIAWQKAYLKLWLAERPEITLRPEELWAAREACIAAISAKNG